MWYEQRDGKPLPYLARFRDAEGKKRARAFLTADERATFADKWQRDRQKYGKKAGLIDATTAQIWAEFAQITGNAPPLKVAREWVEARGMADMLTVQSGWDEFNADQEQRKLSGDTHSHRRLHGKRLCAFLRDKAAASVKTEHIDAWLASIAGGSKSKAHHLKNARHFFQWLADRRKIPHNPCDAVTVPDRTVLGKDGKPVHADVNILTVDDARRLFTANRDHPCVGRLALEAFGGLRYTSAKRLRAADIAWSDKGITMPGHEHKSGKRHYVDGWPDSLWLWLKHAPAACWEMEQREYQDEKRAAFVRAKVKLTHNCLRHSFASYHLAAHKDAKLTAYLMTKTSLQSLNNDYRGRATHAQGLAYFAIVP
jgi:site-specific recombinase XerD